LIAEPSQATAHSLARHQLRAVQLQRDLRVVAFVDDPRANRLALALGQLLDELEHRLLTRRGELVDAGEIVVVEDFGLESQAPAGAEAVGDEEDRGEHFRGQVCRGFAVPRLAQQKRDDRRKVPAVEHGECLPVARHHGAQQLPVGPLLLVWHLASDFARAPGRVTPRQASGPRRHSATISCATSAGGRPVMLIVCTPASLRIQVS
jgi:hypothetical protein